ncbi:DYNc [Geosmithia morbida]|uniref:DYNc n=1 Tax=Geosmithia morbida TaxID=1094350 RepID=A0A9P4YTM1_9HYPO|nr:DYNc [Geosmithia morbida]KAF4121483.1 DYNc [Geosmithia morbida]
MGVAMEPRLLSNPEMLEKIDKLRDLNIGQHIALPQLVVVGDQSSGKSSLLESLSGIPFPKDGTLCTRHATQITFRRNDDVFVKISINAGPHASEEHKKTVEGHRLKMDSAVEFRGQFVDILTKANEKMGLRKTVSAGRGAIFSEDVLKIEVYGPTEDYLTIIDVPGIFRTNMYGTTKEDIVMVRELVKDYIKDDRTIILAVLPSNVDIATQEILELAEEYDPEGASLCDLVNGKRRHLTLGYYLVKNRGPDDGPVEPEELDRFFARNPWRRLPGERLGIRALKAQLEALLIDICGREFPRLVQDLSRSITECKRELQGLGRPRQDENEQRIFLGNVAGAFQDCVRSSLAADYTAIDALGETELRLITNVMNITDVFATDFHEKAHSNNFDEERGHVGKTESEDDLRESQKSSSEAMVKQMRNLLESVHIDDATDGEKAELEDILAIPDKDLESKGGVSSWIRQHYLNIRGLELGTFNANFVSVAFAQQSSKWPHMSKVYMSRVILSLHRFIASALRLVLPDETARNKVWSSILESLVDCYRKAIRQADLLVNIERQGIPYTANKKFTKEINEARSKRMLRQVFPKARKDKAQYGEVQYTVTLEDMDSMHSEEQSNMGYSLQEVHDILQAYYRIAMERFIDNIFQIAVNHQLLHGPDSPLRVFDQNWVMSLRPAQLEQIAGESKASKRTRAKLNKKIEDLSTGRKVLEQY